MSFSFWFSSAAAIVSHVASCTSVMTLTRGSSTIKFFTGLALGLLFASSFEDQKMISVCSHPFRHFLANRFHIFQRKRSLVLVGVITSGTFVPSRAKAQFETWGHELPGDILFFTPEGTNFMSLPLINLSRTNGTLESVGKNFRALKYMKELYGEDYEWFVILDEYTYVRTDRLEDWLRNFKSSNSILIGQTGTELKGKSDFPKWNSSDCLRRSKFILSHKMLEELGPDLEKCHDATSDADFGRCVRNFQHPECLWSSKIAKLFLHIKAESISTGNWKIKEVDEAIFLHSLKQYSNQYRLHTYMKELLVADLNYERVKCWNLLKTPPHAPLQEGLARNTTLEQNLTASEKEVPAWDFVQKRWYTLSSNSPAKGWPKARKGGIEEVILQASEDVRSILKLEEELDIADLSYLWFKLNPICGMQYVINLNVTKISLKSNSSRFPTEVVRSYQHSFGPLEFREVVDDDMPMNEKEKTHKFSKPDKRTKRLKGRKSGKRRDKQRKNTVKGKENKEAEEPILQKQKAITTDSKNVTLKVGKEGSSEVAEGSEQVVGEKLIHMIIPLSGRIPQLVRFMKQYEEVVLKNNELVELVLILYEDPANTSSVPLSADILANFQKDYENFLLKIYQTREAFSRGKALEYGASLCPDDGLLFLTDIDVLFTSDALQRVRTNTKLHTQIYYPIVFGEYDTRIVQNKEEREDHFSVSEEDGLWRLYGYGMVGIYKSDLIAIGGFDKTIIGWGMEDLDLCEKAVQSGFFIFRAVEPGLVHVYHNMQCDKGLQGLQKEMCIASRTNTVASKKLMARLVLEKIKSR